MNKALIGGGLAGLLFFPLLIPLLFMGGSAPLADLTPEEYVEIVGRAGSICPTVTPQIIAAQINQESGWDPTAQSPAGAQGISQAMPATWAESGMDGNDDGHVDVWDPIDSIWSQGHYMCTLAGQVETLLSQGSILGDPLDLTLAAYNAGLGNVKKHGAIPPFKETEHYVKTIRENAANNPAMGPPGATAGSGVNDGATMPGLSSDGTFLVSPKGATSGMLPNNVLCSYGSFQLRCAAAEALRQLNLAYTQQFGTSLKLVGGYRPYSIQVALKAQKGKWAATPGTSNHGWGLAIDIHNASYISESNPKHAWLRANAPAYGWTWPTWARSSLYEPWHWEYTAALKRLPTL